MAFAASSLVAYAPLNVIPIDLELSSRSTVEIFISSQQSSPSRIVIVAVADSEPYCTVIVTVPAAIRLAAPSKGVIAASAALALEYVSPVTSRVLVTASPKPVRK